METPLTTIQIRIKSVRSFRMTPESQEVLHTDTMVESVSWDEGLEMLRQIKTRINGAPLNGHTEPEPALGLDDQWFQDTLTVEGFEGVPPVLVPAAFAALEEALRS